VISGCRKFLASYTPPHISNALSGTSVDVEDLRELGSVG